MSGVRKEVVPFLGAAVVLGGLTTGGLLAARVAGTVCLWSGIGVLLVSAGYLLYFFRDPDRTPPDDPNVAVAGADGTVARITEVYEPHALKTDTVRISIFLSLFDVHVNRAPISGQSTFLGYFPGKRLFTFQEKASDVNQHNKILIKNGRTACLVTQIVGPVCRRVVYWPDHDRAVSLGQGDPIGMMKFGSRLDMYFPKSDVAEVTVTLGATVRAGETVVARFAGGDAA